MRCGSTCLVSLHLDKEDWTWGGKGGLGKPLVWWNFIKFHGILLLLSDLDTIDLLISWNLWFFFVGPALWRSQSPRLEARCSLLPAGVCSWDGWLLGMDGWEGWPWFQFATWLRFYQTRTFLKDFLPNSRTGRCRKHLKTWLFAGNTSVK